MYQCLHSSTGVVCANLKSCSGTSCDLSGQLESMHFKTLAFLKYAFVRVCFVRPCVRRYCRRVSVLRRDKHLQTHHSALLQNNTYSTRRRKHQRRGCLAHGSLGGWESVFFVLFVLRALPLLLLLDFIIHSVFLPCVSLFQELLKLA
jgi:hypothetical protein